MQILKRVVMLVVAAAMVLSMAACVSKVAYVSNEPCEECGDTPTKGYRNERKDELEYYCSRCSSKCYICNDPASKHYTSMVGIIIFACEDCYEDIVE